MERLAILTVYFISVSWAVNGAMATAPVAGRKGYNPWLGAVAGAVLGFAGALLPGLILQRAATNTAGVIGALLGGWALLRLAWRYIPDIDPQQDDLPLGESLRRNIVARHIRGYISRFLFIAAIAVALIALATLVWTIANKTVGLTAVQYEVEPEALAMTAYDPGAYLGEIDPAMIPALLEENVRPVRLQELVLERLVDDDMEDWPPLKTQPLSDLLGDDMIYPAELASATVNDLTPAQAVDILVNNLEAYDLEELAYTEAGREMGALSRDEFVAVLAESFTPEQLQTLILTQIAGISAGEIPSSPVWQVVRIADYEPALSTKPFSMLTGTESAVILVHNLDRDMVKDIIKSEVRAGLVLDERPLVRVLRPLDDLTAEELANVLAMNLDDARMRELVIDLARVPEDERAAVGVEALGQVLQGEDFPAALALLPFGQLNAAQGADILMANLSLSKLQDLVTGEVNRDLYEVGRPLNDLPVEELVGILAEDVRATRLRVLILEAAGVPPTDYATVNDKPVRDVSPDFTIRPEYEQVPLNLLTAQQAAEILGDNLTLDALRDILKLEARDRLLDDLPKTTLAAVLADHVTVERLHVLIVNEVLLANSPGATGLELKPVLSPEQAAAIIMNNMDRDALETLVLREASSSILATRTDEDLAFILAVNMRKDRLQELILTDVVGANPDDRSFSGDPAWQVLKGDAYPLELGERPFNSLTAEEAADILVRVLPREQVEELLILQAERPTLDDVPKRALGSMLAVNLNKNRLRVLIVLDVTGKPESELPKMSAEPISVVLKGYKYPEALADLPFNKVTAAQAADLIARNMSREQLIALLFDEVVEEQVAKGWTLEESLFDRDAIEAYQKANLPRADLTWRSWVNRDFLTNSINYSQADATGVRPALIGSLLVILITILIAFPVGVGAAIYLEEYAGTNIINRIIQTNINNLAGVPSIIYGMLGLAIFVRALSHITSGNFIGTDEPNGRTVFSAGLTLALLILPVIIINAQEAIRAVPGSLRQASYGLGATRWQTIWNHVLPYAMPGILTGTILSVSRAIGETAPLILVGGATYLSQDPDGAFSQFTALPLVIYRLTTLPQDEFRNAAAAAIVVLLALLLTLNSIAVILRNRFTRRLS